MHISWLSKPAQYQKLRPTERQIEALEEREKSEPHWLLLKTTYTSSLLA
jgi:hypothetical protein